MKEKIKVLAAQKEQETSNIMLTYDPISPMTIP